MTTPTPQARAHGIVTDCREGTLRPPLWEALEAAIARAITESVDAAWAAAAQTMDTFGGTYNSEGERADEIATAWRAAGAPAPVEPEQCPVPASRLGHVGRGTP